MPGTSSLLPSVNVRRSREAAERGAGRGVQQQLRCGAEAGQEPRRHAAREAEVQQQDDAAQAPAPPHVGARGHGPEMECPWHALQLGDHLWGTVVEVRARARVTARVQGQGQGQWRLWS